MIRLRGFFLLLVALVFQAAPARAQIEVNIEAEQLKQNLEGKLLRTLQTYLGDRSKVLVNVQFKLSDPNVSSVSAPNPIAIRAPASEDNWVDLGYVSTPGENSLAQTPPTVTKWKIDSTETEIRVAENLDDESVRAVQSLANRTLAGYNPNVSVMRVAFPEAPKPVESPKAEEKKPEAPPAPELSPLEKLIQKYGALIPLLAALVVGLGLFLASGIASTTLARSAGEIASGLRSMRPQVSTAPDKPFAVASAAAENEKKTEPKAVPSRIREHFKNVALLKKILVENPLPFIRSLSDSAEDRMGLKWLLPHLSADERAILKKFLDPERLSGLAENSDDDLSNFDASLWVERNVQSLVLRDIVGGSLLERTLKPEDSLRLSTTEPDRLLGVVTEMNDVAAWRVAVEFLPKDRVQTALQSSDTGFWQKLVAATELDASELQGAADRILELLGNGESSADFENVTSFRRGADERKKFYSNILLDPAVDSVLSKPLGDDDVFLEDLARMAPEFVTLLRRKVWTPKSLQLISDESLREAFKALSPEQKISILWAMPGEASERLQRSLPEGTGRTIVLDTLKKLRDRQDNQEFQSATRLAREFLDFLRVQAEAGRLALGAAPVETFDVPAPAPVEAAVEQAQSETQIGAPTAQDIMAEMAQAYGNMDVAPATTFTPPPPPAREEFFADAGPVAADDEAFEENPLAAEGDTPGEAVETAVVASDAPVDPDSDSDPSDPNKSGNEAA